MQRQAIRQGFCSEEPATGAHGLLANPPAAAEPTSLADSGASATTSDDPGLSLQQHSDVDLDLDVSMGLTDSNADAEGATDDEVVVPSLTPSVPHPLLRSSGTHDHSDRPMLGFVVPKREVTNADTSTRLDHARASPDRGLDFDLTSLTSLGPSVSGGERWADWPTQHGLGGPSISPDTGVGEYAGDGTIDPSVLSGGVSPSKVDEYASSPAGRRADLSRAMEEEYRMDDEEEEDVMGLLFAANVSDDVFVPPSGMGKGKGKSRAVAMDDVVDSSQSVGASSSTKIQRKRRPKLFPDEAEPDQRVKDDDGDHESDEADSRTRAISAPAPALLDVRPKKRRRTTTTTSSSSSTWMFCHHCRCKSRRPKMRCTLIVTSTSERCRKLYCDGCFEKRCAVQLPFHICGTDS